MDGSIEGSKERPTRMHHDLHDLRLLLIQALESRSLEDFDTPTLHEVEEAVEAPEILTLERVTGGDINQVFSVRFPSGRRFLYKRNADATPGFFAAEALGLCTLATPNALKIPQVFAHHKSGLLMEWLVTIDDRGSRVSPANSENNFGETDVGTALGKGLAKIHRTKRHAFGFEKDNFVGLLPQENGDEVSWLTFYRKRRLEPQIRLAEKKGRLSDDRRRYAETLLDQLDRWIDDKTVTPSLLHGDLWAGNWLATPDGPALIDPAVYYGDREMDLAMAALFGGFPPSFYRSYDEVYPLEPGHEERRPLYQLYYLLIHLNIFGEAYGPQVDRILARYGCRKSQAPK